MAEHAGVRGPRDTLEYLRESIRPAWRAPFRGEIYEYASKLNLQGGYAVKGPVRIETLKHLIEPLKAIRDPGVRLVSITGAVQTTKSLLADVTVPYWIEHDPGDCLWLLEDDAKARLYADRVIPLIWSVPEIAAMLEGVNRHDKTKTELKFRHMKLVIAGLNAGNVQSLSWRYVIVDEKWLHPFDGLIRQAKERTKQYPETHKILLIGQGGVEDDDPDVEHKQTDQRVLHYACPNCFQYQPFELSREREPGSKLGKYAGLSWDTNETTRPKGKWKFEEVGKSAHHRCYYCDYRIEDRPEVRRRLNDSFYYFPEGTDESAKAAASQVWKETGDPPAPIPFPKAVGYQWPGEASMRVPFFDLVVKYLRAKIASEELGYRLPLKEYYQKDRGVTWSEMIEGESRAIVQEAYDVHSDWSEEAYRTLIVDCQRDLKKFFVSVYAVSLAGESRELERVTATAWGQPNSNSPSPRPSPQGEGERHPGQNDGEITMAGVQRKWKVKDQHVFVDCGYQMTKVLRECVRHGHVGQIKLGGKTRSVWLCWTGLKGSGTELFCHKNAKNGLKEFKIFSERKFYNVNIGTRDRNPRAPWYEWSNLHCKDLLRDRRDGDPQAPKFLFLPDTLPASDVNSHFQQMRSEKRVEQWTPRGKRAIWVLIKESRPNHEWDKAAMVIVFQAIVGIIGAPDETPES
jgi:hypothetical protein